MNTVVTAITSFFIVAGATFVAGRADSAPPPTVFPGVNWQEASPESQGVDSAKLSAAVDCRRIPFSLDPTDRSP